MKDSPAHGRSLTFGDLDDLFSLPHCEWIDAVRSLSNEIPAGPLIELYYTLPNWTMGVPVPSPQARSLDAALKTKFGNLPSDFSLNGRHVEFITTPSTSEDSLDPRWNAFCRRFTNSAVDAGHEKSFASALTGVLDELAGNIVEHSETAETGIVGYQSSPGRFEFCIADRGIGALQSFLKSGLYPEIVDAGQALTTMIQDGQSSKGRDEGFGFGFHDLTHNIAKRSSILRFRSADHSLTIDGCGEHVSQIVSQVAEFQGLLISIISHA